MHRWNLLAELLGIAPNQMAWNHYDSESLDWISGAAFREDIRQLVSKREAELQLTGVALQSKGLLTDAEAKTTRPKLKISVYDHRSDAHTPLLWDSTSDPRTVIELSTLQ